MIKCDVIIMGAGAAGLMAARKCAMRGRKVIIFEHNDQIAKKILISGGGKCNFTNIFTKPENFISQNPHFCKSALSRFTPFDFIDILNDYSINYFEKKLGQLFCSDSSQKIISMFNEELNKNSVIVKLNSKVTQIIKSESFEVIIDNEVYESESLIIATGGISIPKIGASDFAYKTAEQFGLNIIQPKPALVPFVFSEREQNIFSELSGISIDAIVSFGKTSFRENLLFTHKGLSGPAILQISSYWVPKEPVEINFSPDKDISEFIQNNRQRNITLPQLLAESFPKRFIEIFSKNYLPKKYLPSLSNIDIQNAANIFHRWSFIPLDTEGYNKAEVTSGGIDTKELSSKTMEAKKVKGLYFIGECVDVTGQLGGFNFQWAWSSGYAAGQFA